METTTEMSSFSSELLDPSRFSPPASAVLVPGSSERSNDLGEYRIHGLSGGKYYVIAIFRKPVTRRK